MFTIVLKKLFGFLITLMVGFSKFSNSQTTEKTEMVLVAIIIISIFLQSNDVTIVLNVVREFGGFPSEYVVMTR